jgi:hypothetical protein
MAAMLTGASALTMSGSVSLRPGSGNVAGLVRPRPARAGARRAVVLARASAEERVPEPARLLMAAAAAAAIAMPGAQRATSARPLCAPRCRRRRRRAHAAACAPGARHAPRTRTAHPYTARSRRCWQLRRGARLIGTVALRGAICLPSLTRTR